MDRVPIHAWQLYITPAGLPQLSYSDVYTCTLKIVGMGYSTSISTYAALVVDLERTLGMIAILARRQLNRSDKLPLEGLVLRVRSSYISLRHTS